MSATVSQITCISIVYLTVSSDRDQRKQKFRVTGPCVGNSPVIPRTQGHAVTRKKFSFDDVITKCLLFAHTSVFHLSTCRRSIVKNTPVKHREHWWSICWRMASCQTGRAKCKAFRFCTKTSLLWHLIPLWVSVGMRRGFAPHFRKVDDLLPPKIWPCLPFYSDLVGS